MTWSTDFEAAPRDRQILVATKAGRGKVTKIVFFTTNWLEPSKDTPHRMMVGRWNGFPAKPKSMIAWCEIPNYETQESGTTDPASLMGANTGGSHVTGSAARAPLIMKHIFLESMSQGE